MRCAMTNAGASRSRDARESARAPTWTETREGPRPGAPTTRPARRPGARRAENRADPASLRVIEFVDATDDVDRRCATRQVPSTRRCWIAAGVSSRSACRRPMTPSCRKRSMSVRRKSRTGWCRPAGAAVRVPRTSSLRPATAVSPVNRILWITDGYPQPRRSWTSTTATAAVDVQDRETGTTTMVRMTMGTLVLLRHGESEWNAKNLFTGWVDVDLTAKGEAEARRGGELLRAARSAARCRAHQRPEAGHPHRGAVVVRRRPAAGSPCAGSWRLNERHYGALQGKNKKETLEQYGEEQFMLWRRSYDVPPPPIADDDEYSQAGDPRYADAAAGAQSPHRVPQGRRAAHAAVLVRRRSCPDLLAGRTVLVAAHGNSLRAPGQAPGRHLRRGDRQAEHPHRHPAAVRPGRATCGRSPRAAPTSTRRPPARPRPPSPTRAADGQTLAHA